MTKNSQTRTHRLFFRQCSNISQAIQWKAAPLRAEWQPISDRRRVCQLRRKKSNNPHIVALRRKDVFSSSHRSLRSRSYRQWSFARTLSPRTLSIGWLCFRSTFLGACACIHPFSSLLSMLGSHRDQWEACVAAWRFIHCLAIVEGGKSRDARGSSSSPLRPCKAPKCVRREYVLSVSLRFHGFGAWQNRNCQSEYCLTRRDFFF